MSAIADLTHAPLDIDTPAASYENQRLWLLMASDNNEAGYKLDTLEAGLVCVTQKEHANEFLGTKTDSICTAIPTTVRNVIQRSIIYGYDRWYLWYVGPVKEEDWVDVIPVVIL